MDTGLYFRILGPLEVHSGPQQVVVGGLRQRAILARLLLSANRIVSVDSLFDAVWEGAPPNTARTQVAICVAGLRKAFRGVGCTDEVIATAAPGYLLHTQGHRLDVLDFAEQVERARALAGTGALADAARVLSAALELWRGPALAGISSYPVENEAARLEEQRLTAHELCAEWKLELGQHRSLIGELRAMVGAYPLRERARGQLMLAQYRSGRRAEALETFREGRRRSIEEFGIEPGPALQEAHEAMLRDDPGLMAPDDLITVVPQDDPVVPAQLPPSVPGFTGRVAELSTLDKLLGAGAAGRPLVVGSVTGGAGVGKTELGLHWAHRVAGQFPDGRLFADLHGYDEHHAPMAASAVLAQFVRALGVPSGQLPTDPDELAGLYRSLLDGRRMLIVLDNAKTFAQVQPLLPGNGCCCVVVTSRDPLSEPLGTQGSVRLRLGTLPMAESLDLLGGMVGAERVAAERPKAERLATLCDGLPLALRIAGSRLVAKPHWTIGHLVALLEDERGRLDALSQGERELRTGFELSYRDLAPATATMYRRLAMIDVSEFTVWMAAAVMATSWGEAERLVERLVDAQLLEVIGGAETGAKYHFMRYRFPALVRLHARERAELEQRLTGLGCA